MIDPTESDIGRKVVYNGDQRNYGGVAWAGVITSFNKAWVFVRYGPPGTTSQATARSDLEWGDEDRPSIELFPWRWE